MEKEEIPVSSAAMTAASDPELADKGDANKDPDPQEKKKYYTVTIPKSLISEYKVGQGVRIVLSFRDGNGIHIPLVFTGFNSVGFPFISRELQRKGQDSIDSRNVFYGIIFQDDKNKLLHDLLATGVEKDWTLTPEEYDTEKNYVRYQLSDDRTLLPVSKLNPSPPA